MTTTNIPRCTSDALMQVFFTVEETRCAAGDVLAIAEALRAKRIWLTETGEVNEAVITAVIHRYALALDFINDPDRKLRLSASGDLTSHPRGSQFSPFFFAALACTTAAFCDSPPAYVYDPEQTLTAIAKARELANEYAASQRR